MARRINRNYYRMRENITAQQSVNNLFEQLEPFFTKIFETLENFTVQERETFQTAFKKYYEQEKSSTYDLFFDTFRKRIRKGFQFSINLLKQYPFDEKFPTHLKNQLSQFEYAKQTILVLFKSQTYGASEGGDETIELFVNNHWNIEYLRQLNEELDLIHILTMIFSASRRSGNKDSVLPVKTILKYYEEIDNAEYNIQKTKFIEEFLIEFEKTAIADYKEKLSENWRDGIHSFLKRSLKFVYEEDYRIENGLIEPISEKLKELLLENYIMKDYDELLRQFNEVMKAEDDEECQSIVYLFERNEKLEPFAKKSAEYFKNKCLERILHEIEKRQNAIPIHRDIQYVMKLFMEFYDDFDHKIKESFKNSHHFINYISNSLKEVLENNKINSCDPNSKRYIERSLSYFLDKVLRKNPKFLNGMKVESLIDKCIGILSIISNNDAFEAYYFCELRNRLIENSIDDGLENYVIEKFKMLKKFEFIARLNKIIQDCNNKENIKEKFNQYCNKKHIQLPNLKCNYYVFSQFESNDNLFNKLTQINDEAKDFIHPQMARGYIEEFINFQKENDRNTKIDVYQSNGVIELKWKNVKCEIICKYGQMAILALFNEEPVLTFKQIQEKTKLTDSKMLEYLSGIVSKNLLTCSTSEKFTLQSEFKFNTEFKPKTSRINVKQADKKYRADIQRKINEQIENHIEENRKYIIQCAVVRIMKQRKVLEIKELKEETVDIIKKTISANTKEVQKIIDELLKKEDTLQRSTENPKVIEYKA